MSGVVLLALTTFIGTMVDWGGVTEPVSPPTSDMEVNPSTASGGPATVPPVMRQAVTRSELGRVVAQLVWDDSEQPASNVSIRLNTEMRPGEQSAYMLLVADVRSEKRLARNGQENAEGLDKLKEERSVVPAITHVDYSARVQTVDAERHGRYYKLIKAFEQKTGCPVVINTSFNIRGEPIVCSPEHAYRCFMATNMDVLVIEDFVLEKEEQPNATEVEIEGYLKDFPLD